LSYPLILELSLLLSLVDVWILDIVS
jgi:hypothetical protein